jgi:CheY-like chemotaxis protein
MLAEGHNEEAERVARAAVDTLDKGDHQHLLAEALTTQGTALARLGRHQHARLTFQHAIVVAEQAGDPEGAGNATLTAIEELTDLFPARELGQMYERASDLLTASPQLTTRARLTEGAGRVIRAISADLKPEAERGEEFKPPSSWHDFHFWKEIRRYEAYLIERALKEAGGIVTRAAQLLGFKHHQSLNALLKGRHKDLLHLRSPIEPRKRSIFRVSSPRNTPECRTRKEPRTVTILHVEDNEIVADAVKDTLELEGWKVELCADGISALNKLAGGAHYDLLIFDYDLPGASGIELIRYARSLPHCRRTPIIMFSATDREADARRAGADVFLLKPNDVGLITTTIRRFLNVETTEH